MNRHISFCLVLIIWLTLVACKTPQKNTSDEKSIMPAPLSSVFRLSKLGEIDAAILQSIDDKKAPGAVLRIANSGLVYKKAYGHKSIKPERSSMQYETIFDAASLTKVIATAPSIALLVEQGKLGLNDKVDQWVPGFKKNGKGAITIRHLLTHTSGLRPGLSLRQEWFGVEAAVEKAKAERINFQPNTRFVYSDINFILLGEIVRLASGQGLDKFASENIFEPLRMKDTGFKPSSEKLGNIAPTEQLGEIILHGEVHDPTARRMGGVAGHAGLFTTAKDLGIFASMMLNGGKYDGRKIFSKETIELMVTAQTAPEMKIQRGLGWDISSPYSSPRGNHFHLGSYGHTGWTGCSIWIDPSTRTSVILMTNRVHPDGSGNVISLRRKVATLAAESLRHFSLGASDSARLNSDKIVLNGADVLRMRPDILPKGSKVGLITNHTGHDRNRNSTLDFLLTTKHVKLTALFSPEHGLYGNLDQKIGDATDAKTGLKIFSLYGKTRKPLMDQLAGLDSLIFDIQDIGCRFYTYISTMGLAMEAASEAGINFIVLDRVNPIGAADVEGPVRLGSTDFIAFHDIPVKHGMTVGELARMFNRERAYEVKLQVVKIQDWSRSQTFDETGQPWTNPSPNMRNLNQAMLYPGIGLLETALSVGRGTDTPFEVIGAPYINDVHLAERLNALGEEGVRFVPIQFTPSASIHKAQECGGVNIIITNRTKLKPVFLGIAIARELHAMYPKQFPLLKVERLLCHSPTIRAIEKGKTMNQIEELWRPDLDKFNKRRAEFLIYK